MVGRPLVQLRCIRIWPETQLACKYVCDWPAFYIRAITTLFNVLTAKSFKRFNMGKTFNIVRFLLNCPFLVNMDFMLHIVFDSCLSFHCYAFIINVYSLLSTHYYRLKQSSWRVEDCKAKSEAEYLEFTGFWCFYRRQRTMLMQPSIVVEFSRGK